MASQQPTAGHFGQDLGSNPETQQSFDFSAFGGLIDSGPAFFAPGVQNGVQEATSHQLDVSPNYAPMDLDQATTVPVPQASLPPTAPPVEINSDNGTITLPAWLSLVRPQSQDQVIRVRRECQVALAIKFKELFALSGSRPVKSLVVPSTANVKTEKDYEERDVMHFSVRVFGADTESEYKSPCEKCSKREGKKKGNPRLVDFYAVSNVLKPSDDGLVLVTFKFCCYPNHQNPNEGAYLLEVTLFENQYQGQMVSSQKVVTTCRLPWHFKLGKRPADQGTAAAPANDPEPPQNDPSCPSGQQTMDIDTLTPRSCALIQSPPGPSPVEINSDNGTITLPAWLSLVRPQPEDQVVKVRRECQVALDINFKELPALPGPRPVTRKSLVVPSTTNVKTNKYRDEGDAVHLSIRVFGADTKNEYKSVCNKCSTREGKKKGKPSLVDFYAASNVIKASDDGSAQVSFKFCCYPNHQNPNESAYLLEVALSENQNRGQMVSSQKVVATYRLPWHFKLGKLRPGLGATASHANGAVLSLNDPGRPNEQQSMAFDALTPRSCARNEPGVPTQELLIPSSPGSLSLSEGEHQGASCVPTSNTQAPVARGPGANWVAGSMQRKRGRAEAELDNEVSHHTTCKRPRREQRNIVPTGTAGPSAPSADHPRPCPFTIAAGTASHGVSSSNSSPAASATPSTPQPDQSLRPVRRRQRSAQPTDSRRTTILRAANPRSGPVSGGREIWLEMDDLPTTFTLYARFGDKVAATSVRNEHVLSCVLPSASHAGRVQVTLSRSADPRAPQYGTSLAEFEYVSDDASLIPLLLRMEEKGSDEYTSAIRAIVRMLEEDRAWQGSGNPQDGQIESPVLQEPPPSQVEQIESSLLEGLLSLRAEPNFDDIVSTRSDSNQTLAHISVLNNYMSLLKQLVEWRIDLTVADISGLTALHCAYQKDDRESIRILLRGGASTAIADKLGRFPRDLAPEGSDFADWVNRV